VVGGDSVASGTAIRQELNSEDAVGYPASHPYCID